MNERAGVACLLSFAHTARSSLTHTHNTYVYYYVQHSSAHLFCMHGTTVHHPIHPISLWSAKICRAPSSVFKLKTLSIKDKSRTSTAMWSFSSDSLSLSLLLSLSAVSFFLNGVSLLFRSSIRLTSAQNYTIAVWTHSETIFHTFQISLFRILIHKWNVMATLLTLSPQIIHMYTWEVYVCLCLLHTNGVSHLNVMNNLTTFFCPCCCCSCAWLFHHHPRSLRSFFALTTVGNRFCVRPTVCFVTCPRLFHDNLELYKWRKCSKLHSVGQKWQCDWATTKRWWMADVVRITQRTCKTNSAPIEWKEVL